MRELKSKTSLIIALILGLAALFNLTAVYSIFSIVVTIACVLVCAIFTIVLYWESTNVMLAVKVYSQIDENKVRMAYQGFNLVCKCTIVALLILMDYPLTVVLYVTANLVIFHWMKKSGEAKALLADAKPLLMPLSQFEKEATECGYVFVGNTGVMLDPKYVKIGCVPNDVWNIVQLGVCKTKDDLEVLVDLLKTKGWLK